MSDIGKDHDKREPFLKILEEKLKETYDWAKSDPAQLEKFMSGVRESIDGDESKVLLADSPVLHAAWKAAGMEVRLNDHSLKRLRRAVKESPIPQIELEVEAYLECEKELKNAEERLNRAVQPLIIAAQDSAEDLVELAEMLPKGYEGGRRVYEAILKKLQQKDE